jgi:beclin 1
MDAQLAAAARQREQLEREEAHYWREYSRHKHQLLLAEDEYRSLDSQLRAGQAALEKLKKTNVFNATFHIWHAGHFGTINGFRLGRLPSVPVDWNEVNTAWGQTVLLLHSLCRKIGLSLQRYQLVPYGNFSYVKVLGAEERDFPLYGSGGFRLMWDTKFDAGMTAFLDCLQQFKVNKRKPDRLICVNLCVTIG